MSHHTNARFWRCYQGLPKEIRDLADRNYALLKSDQSHNSLQFKKVGSLAERRFSPIGLGENG